VLWYGLGLLGIDFLAPSIWTLAALDSVEVFVGAHSETIFSAAIWGLFIGFALVTAGVAGIVGGEQRGE
jgi:hypothetical protein